MVFNRSLTDCHLARRLVGTARLRSMTNNMHRNDRPPSDEIDLKIGRSLVVSGMFIFIMTAVLGLVWLLSHDAPASLAVLAVAFFVMAVVAVVVGNMKIKKVFGSHELR